MPNPFVYTVGADLKLSWYRHIGVTDGTFNWQGPHEVGRGWDFKHVFSGGDGIIYAIEHVVEANAHVIGPAAPASGGNLLWFRHLGQADGSFRWEGPKKVGVGWGSFEHVFYAGNGIIYAVEPAVPAMAHVVGKPTPASGGNLLWFRHLGREDGSFRWTDTKKVGTGWSGFERVFSGGEGVIYLVEPFVPAMAHLVGKPTPASGGNLRWYRHLGQQDGSFRWEGPKKVGTGWAGFREMFSADNGVIYLVEPAVEATVDVKGKVTPASGGKLRWYRHIGREDGSFRWEGPKIVGSGWSGLKEVFSGGGDAATVEANTNYCGTPNPDRNGTITPLTFGSPGGRWSRTSLRFSIKTAGCKGITAATATSKITQAFGLWQAAAPFLSLQRVTSNGDVQVAFAGPEVDERFGKEGGVVGIGHYPEAGRLFFDSAETWTAEKLLVTAVHEIGHVLGLRHSNTRASIMYPYTLSQKTALATAGTLAVEAESADALRQMYGWSPQAGLTDRGTTDRPALALTSEANFGGESSTLHMAWGGASGDSGVYWSQLSGGNWGPQQNIPGIGSSHSPSLTSVPLPGDVPRQGLFMVWKGVGRDQALYWSRNDGPGWQSQAQVPGAGSSSRPAVAQFNGRTYVAWKGAGRDSGIYWSTFDGANWAPQRNILGVGTSDSPALVTFNNRLHMFWKGTAGDSNAYHSTLDNGEGSIWLPQQRVSYVEAQVDGMVNVDIGTSGAVSACVRGNRIMLAWKGVSGDSGIYFSLFDDQEFTGQIRMRDVGTSVGPTVLELDGQTHMLWKGIQGDSRIYWSRM